MPDITTPFTLTRNGNHIILSFSGDIVIWRQQNVILTKNNDDTVTLTDQVVSYTMSFTDSLNPVASSANDFLIEVSKIINEQPLQYSAFGEISSSELTPIIQLEFPYLINPRLLSSATTGGATIGVVTAMANVSVGPTTASSGLLQSIKTVKYRAGQGIECQFSALYTTGVASTVQEIGILGITDGFAFGFDGADFGILHRNDGTDTWTATTNWNVDKADNSGVLPVLDPTKLNAYKISFGGYNGAFSFDIQDPITGFYIPVHRIKYSNANTIPAFGNASLPFCVATNNIGTTETLTINCSSALCSVQGSIFGGAQDTALTNAFSNTFTGVNTTIDNVFTLRTKTSFGGSPSKVEVLIKRISIGTDGNGIVIVEVFQNGTLTTPSFVDVDATSSIMETDIVGTSLTGGDLVFSTVVQKADASSQSVVELNIVMAPGDTLSFAARTFASTNDVTIVANWSEDF